MREYMKEIQAAGTSLELSLPPVFLPIMFTDHTP